GAHIVALAHALGRIVALPKGLQQPLVGDFLRVIDHQHDLVVPGAPAADLLIGRVGRDARRIADSRDMDAVAQLPEFTFRAPEAAEPEHRGLETRRIGSLEGMTVDEMMARGRDRLRPARKRLRGGRHFQRFLEHEHRRSPSATCRRNIGAGAAARSRPDNHICGSLSERRPALRAKKPPGLWSRRPLPKILLKMRSRGYLRPATPACEITSS